MKKTETSLETLLEDLKQHFDYRKWHFMTVNGVNLGDGTIELQWIFNRYGVKDAIEAYYVVITPDQSVPSVTSLFPAAIMSEREVVDLFGISIEGAEKGLFLDEDSEQKPLGVQS